MAGNDTILFEQMVGKNLYALRKVNLRRKGKIFRTAQKNQLLGRMKRWAVDDSGAIKAIRQDWWNVPKLLSRRRLVIIFDGGNSGDYYMYVDPKGGQIDPKSLIAQGAKTTAQESEELQKKYDESPLDALTESGSSILKKYWPLVAAGLITIVLIRKI